MSSHGELRVHVKWVVVFVSNWIQYLSYVHQVLHCLWFVSVLDVHSFSPFWLFVSRCTYYKMNEKKNKIGPFDCTDMERALVFALWSSWQLSQRQHAPVRSSIFFFHWFVTSNSWTHRIIDVIVCSYIIFFFCCYTSFNRHSYSQRNNATEREKNPKELKQRISVHLNYILCVLMYNIHDKY